MGRKGLTPKQSRFVKEYLIDLNATQAAIRAGYSSHRANAIGYENLTKPDVAAAVQREMKARAERTEITQDMVLRELAKIGFADIRRAVTWGETELRVADGEDGTAVPYHGLALKASDEIDDDTAAAISEVAQTKEGLRVKFHDKRAALVDVGRHLGMFKDKVEHSGKDGGPIQSESVTKVVIVPAKIPAVVETKPLQRDDQD